MFDLNIQNLTFIGIALVLFSVIGLFSAVRAILTARTSQGATAWTIALLTWPIFAVPAFWVFGRNKFYGYINARRDRDDAAFAALMHVQERIKPYVVDLGSHFGEARVLERLARLPFTRSNETALLINGKATFDAVFQAIDSATKYILLEFFIINDDELGRQLKDRLIAKAAADVSVYLLYDDIGSQRMTWSYVEDLRQAGVKVTGMNTTRGRWNRLQLNFRNHRKIVVVDGQVAFIGGHNVGDEYLGRHRKLTPWRDTHISFRGPAVLGAQLAFVEDWYWATQHLPDLPWDPCPSKTHDRAVFVLPSGPADEFESCGLFFAHAIHSAKERLWIATPYFVPDEAIVTALQLAALRGVDVRILIPGIPDKPLIKLASMAYVEKVIGAGVQVYEYGKGFMHQKVMLIDDHVSTIGTANFDNRSFRLNFEISVLTIDEDFADEVKVMLLEDMEASTLISREMLDARSYLSILGSQVARLFAPVM